ncbi:MAG TPA: LacI family DNA-binding transcriptional regulator [Marmoricola sp.]|jgi:LacI family transcriptional regulator|nr:LacI family DNA-binding transcriptional regulator [Marmoricola sp.]
MAVRPGRIRLADVARRAGVSATTASYILNGRSAQMRISAQTEQRVRQAARELDYRPNWSARNLRRASTQTIGLISDFVASGAFAGQFISGAGLAARSCDHLLVIGETLGDPETEQLLVREMLARQVDGVVYATLTATRVRLPRELLGVRVVQLNCLDPRHPVPAVLPDDHGAGVAAAQHLLGVGLGRTCHVLGAEDEIETGAGRERVAGLVEGLSVAGHRLAGTVPCAWDVGPARQALDAWLASGNATEALVCLNDRIAMGAYEALGRHRLRVPDDVSVLSFDGSELASWLEPALSSFALPFHAMGSRAVQTLMDPGWHEAGVVRLPLELRIGGSVRGATASPVVRAPAS